MKHNLKKLILKKALTMEIDTTEVRRQLIDKGFERSKLSRCWNNKEVKLSPEEIKICTNYFDIEFDELFSSGESSTKKLAEDLHFTKY
jgi:hypothetical protein